MPTVQTSKLLNLPVTVLQDIFVELHKTDPEALSNLRLVSRACRLESCFLFFRSITLHDSHRSSQATALALAQRLSNPDDAALRYMRQLQVGPFSDEEWFSHNVLPLLEPIIRGARKLQSLTWKTNVPMTPGSLGAFQEHHGRADLQVLSHDRGFHPIARDLLSSPQLHTIETPILCRDRCGISQSQLYVLKRCLMQGGSVKVLRIDLKDVTLQNPGSDASFKDWQDCPQGPWNFDWQEGDKFPALEELSIDPSRYLFSPGDCSMWMQVMNWSNLHKLDLYHGAPLYLLKALTEKVPKLRSLKCGINSSRTWNSLDCDLHTFLKFINSITNLQDFVFQTIKYSDLMDTLESALESHGQTLRTLDISCPSHSSSQWPSNKYAQVLGQAPKLQMISVQLNNTQAIGRWDSQTKMRDKWQKYESLAWKKPLDPLEYRPFYIRGDGLDLRGM